MLGQARTIQCVRPHSRVLHAAVAAGRVAFCSWHRASATAAVSPSASTRRHSTSRDMVGAGSPVRVHGAEHAPHGRAT